MGAIEPANHALLTMAALGAKAVTSCARCVILERLGPDDLAEFRAVLVDANKAGQSTIELIDLHLARELAQSRED